MSVPTPYVVALALTVSDDARGFVSRAAAGAGRATADQVREALNPTRDTSAAWLAEMHAGTHARIDDGRADAALGVIRAVDGEGDWATNLRTIATGEWTDYTHLPLIVSGLAVIRRQTENTAREQAPAPTAGYAAPVGTKVKGVHVTVTAVREFESFNPYTGYEETRSQIVMADDAGHQLIWWTTTDPDVEPGQTATLTGGTVKKHDVYRDVDQTVLTRCKFAVDAPGTAMSAPHMK